jgi:hypothetical protein
MATINTIETESVQVGRALAPPISAVDVWPSLDPTAPFSLQNWGISNFQGVHNQIGLHNGIGAHILTGLSSLIGFKTAVGGETNAQPAKEDAALTQTISAATLLELWCGPTTHITLNPTAGFLSGAWTLDGTAFCLAPCSDERAKVNIIKLESSLDKILSLKGVSFDWNSEVVPTLAAEQHRQIGLIAQEVEEIVPEVVNVEKVEGQELKSVRYENLVALLIEGMKEQQDQINSLKETVQELSTKLAECCP